MNNRYNPNCDKQMCLTSSGEVRVLSIVTEDDWGNANIIICKHCFDLEMCFRRNQIKHFNTKWDIPLWNDLEIYNE